jgi:hypothetical protein
MPVPHEVLAGLETIANEWRLLAVLWHVYLGLVTICLILGIRPTRRTAGLLLALPLISVSVLAWVHGNPFNGLLFALAGIALLAVAARLGGGAVRVGPRWLTGFGALMFTFGWAYPHFLDGSSRWIYLYAAPTGLIPCPTLAIVIGLTLIVDGLGSRLWSLVLAAMGLFYGVFGAVRLGVRIDWMLFLGALVALLLVFRSPSSPNDRAAQAP